MDWERKCFLCFFLATHIFVPQLGIKLNPLAVKAQSLNRWTTRDIPKKEVFWLSLLPPVCERDSRPRITGMAEHTTSKTGQVKWTVFFSHIHSQSGGGGHQIPCTWEQSEQLEAGFAVSRRWGAPWFLQEGMAGLSEWFHNWQETETQYSRTSTVPGAHGKKSCLARGPQLWEQSGDRNLLLGYSRFHQVSRQHIIIIP